MSGNRKKEMKGNEWIVRQLGRVGSESRMNPHRNMNDNEERGERITMKAIMMSTFLPSRDNVDTI